MNYCQTDHYDELLQRSYATPTKIVNGVHMQRRSRWKGWTAIGIEWNDYLNLRSDRIRGRVRCIPCMESAPGAQAWWQMDITPQPVHTVAVEKAMRRASRQGVTVRIVEDFTDWHFTSGRLYRKEHPPQGEAGEIFWQYALGHWCHFVAEVDNVVVGTLGFYWWDGVATEVMSRTCPSARDLQVGEPLHVVAIDYAHFLGCHTFVLGGEGTPGIGTFKAKFGGTKTWVVNARL